MNENEVIPTKVRIPAWVSTVLRHSLALLLALSGVAVMLFSLVAGAIAGSAALGGMGLLGGAILAACGGTVLVWSLARGAA